MSCAHGPERGNVELGFTIAAWHRIRSAALLEGLKDRFDRVLEFLFGIEDYVVLSWEKASGERPDKNERRALDPHSHTSLCTQRAADPNSKVLIDYFKNC